MADLLGEAIVGSSMLGSVERVAEFRLAGCCVLCGFPMVADSTVPSIFGSLGASWALLAALGPAGDCRWAAGSW